MGDYKPQTGDRVRVVLEGEVTTVGPEGPGTFNLGGVSTDGQFQNTVRLEAKRTVSVEKIEPPVVTFKPGDVVRHRGDLKNWGEYDRRTYALARDGWIMLREGASDSWAPGFTKGNVAREFTSDVFELVDLSK